MAKLVFPCQRVFFNSWGFCFASENSLNLVERDYCFFSSRLNRLQIKDCWVSWMSKSSLHSYINQNEVTGSAYENH